jgi:hypothetical protein
VTAQTQAAAHRAPDTTRAVAGLIGYFETAEAPDGLFAPDIFVDITLPRWRVQCGTAAELLAARAALHPHPGRLRVGRVEQTGHGFTMEFEEHWDDGGQLWHAREMIRADVVDDSIVDMAVYCTGDWDDARRREHAAAVALIRP